MSERYRIKRTGCNDCTLHKAGDDGMHLNDYSFSQTVALLLDVDRDTRERFWAHEEVTLASGERLLFVKQV